MANEISVNTRLKLNNTSVSTTNPFKINFEPPTVTFDQTAIGGEQKVVSVGTSEEDLSLGDVSTLGWCALQNLDGTNYVTYGPKDTTMKAFGRIEPGEVAVFRLEPGITLRWQANTAAVKVLITVLED